MWVVVVEMDVEGWVVVFCEVGVDGACVGFVGASAARADRCISVSFVW